MLGRRCVCNLSRSSWARMQPWSTTAAREPVCENPRGSNHREIVRVTPPRDVAVRISDDEGRQCERAKNQHHQRQQPSGEKVEKSAEYADTGHDEGKSREMAQKSPPSGIHFGTMLAVSAMPVNCANPKLIVERPKTQRAILVSFAAHADPDGAVDA